MDGDLGGTNSIWLIDPAASFATKYRLMFLCQVDAERKRMTGVTASAKAVYPMITNADAGRGQGVVAGERLLSSCVVVAAREDHAARGIEDFASPLCIAAQCGRRSVGIPDNDLLTVLAEQSG